MASFLLTGKFGAPPRRAAIIIILSPKKLTPINFMTSFAKFVKLMQSTNSDCNFKCNLKVILAAVGDDQSKVIWPISSEYAAKLIFDQMAANPYHDQPYGLLRVAEEGAAPRGHEPTPTPKIAIHRDPNSKN